MTATPALGLVRLSVQAPSCGQLPRHFWFLAFRASRFEPKQPVTSVNEDQESSEHNIIRWSNLTPNVYDGVFPAADLLLPSSISRAQSLLSAYMQVTQMV